MPSDAPEQYEDTPSSEQTIGQRLKSLAGSPRSLVSWALASRRRAVVVGVACLVSVAGVVLAGSAIATRTKASGPVVTLDEALVALDSGAYTQAEDLTKRIQEQETLPFDKLGGPAFVLGVVAAHRAEDAWSKEKKPLHLLAVKYLEEARDRGFPPGRRAEGLYLLGRSLFSSGQIPASRSILSEALKINPQKQDEIHWLLASANFRDANPRLDEALANNTAYLASRRLLPADRHRGLVQRAQILLRMDRPAECVAVLDKIPADAADLAEAIIVRGQVLMREAQGLKDEADLTAQDYVKIRQKYQEAVKTLRIAQGHDTLTTQATRKALYLIGVCFLELGDFRAALDQFTRTSKLYVDTPEGLAAAFQEAELARQMGRDADALAAYRQALGGITSPRNFSNPWISLDQLRNRALVAYEHYLKTQNFETGLELARLLYPLFSRTRAAELIGQAYRTWGENLLSQAARLPRGEASELETEGRERYRRAGSIYARLARLKATTREYPDEIWNSAEAFIRGHDYQNAAKMLRIYLRDQARRRHPQALVLLGEAMLSMGKVDEALEQFEECMEFYPRDIAAFQARLLAAAASIEKAEMKLAEDLLLENLNGDFLSPQSVEWRDSLFALGELYHTEGRYPDAIRRLEEAVTRYPEGQQSLRGRYLIGDSYHRLAEQRQAELQGDLPGATRNVQSKQIREFFGKAREQYETIQDVLCKRQETTELLPVERAMLRNTYFAIGGVLFREGRYEEAINAYTSATNRYQNHPEVLEAYVQIADAYQRLNDLEKARITLENAKVVLGLMKTDIPFTQATNYTREQWVQRIDWLLTLLDAGGSEEIAAGNQVSVVGGWRIGDKDTWT